MAGLEAQAGLQSPAFQRICLRALQEIPETTVLEVQTVTLAHWATPVGLATRVQQVQTVIPEQRGLQEVALRPEPQVIPAVPQILQTQTHLL
jgi:hypothetical protein